MHIENYKIINLDSFFDSICCTYASNYQLKINRHGKMFVRNCNDCENTSTWRIGNEFNLILDGDVVVYSNQSSRWCEVF